MGVTAFVLKYRLARDAGATYSIERDAAADLRRALRWVRAHAAQFKVDPQRLGVPATAAQAAPPAFIVAGSSDTCCAPPSVALYQQLIAAGVSAELHLYADTGHAFNMGQRSERLSDAHWPDRLADWLADGGWLVPGGGKEGVPAPAR